MRILEPLYIDYGDTSGLDTRLEQILAGNGHAILPVPTYDKAYAQLLLNVLGPYEPIDDAISVVIATSGTIGVPKGAQITLSNLWSSIHDSIRALGPAGAWMLALPGHHIAGLQVQLRSLAAGYTPYRLDLSQGFSLDTFIAAEENFSVNAPRYISLVPNLLHKIINDPDASRALAQFDGVLIGGAQTPISLQQAAAAANIKAVYSYGLSETTGGCIYNGYPFTHTTIDLIPITDDSMITHKYSALPSIKNSLKNNSNDESNYGQICIGGTTIARGYRNYPDHPNFFRPGWFRTQDLGMMIENKLIVCGRLDEAISVGGIIVLPQIVEQSIMELSCIIDCAIFGIDDSRLGQKIIAAVVLSPDHNTENSLSITELVQDHVRKSLGRYPIPKQVYIMHDFPRKGPGKVDRQALISIISKYK